MVEITVGVPVYNGDEYLEQCLESLSRQTFSDFRVLIYDNASEDATPEICQQLTDRDSRFHYYRQPENKGAAQNFIDVMEAAQSKYFLWRAHDDTSTDNFLEVTHRLITTTPGAKLAVGRVRSRKPARGKETVHPFPKLSGPKLWRIQQLLFRSHASWFYGLWDLSALKECFYAAWEAYPHLWAHDHLTLFPVLLDQAIVASHDTDFIQNIVEKKSYHLAPKRKDLAQKTKMMALRRQFLAYCHSVLNERGFSPSERAVLNVLTWHYAGKRIYKTPRVWRYNVQRALRPAFVPDEAR